MQLHAYLQLRNISTEDFARFIGKSPGAVRKWRYAERVPRPAIIRLIRDATGGAVSAEDFMERRPRLVRSASDAPEAA